MSWRIGVLVALTILAYANSFGTGFALDNKALILEDARVHAATRANLDLIVQHTYWWPIGESGLYRPLTTLSYLFNYAILGNEDRPAGYHAVNLFLHIVNLLLVYVVMARLIGPAGPAEAADHGPAKAGRHAQKRAASGKVPPSYMASDCSRTHSTAPAAIAALWAVHPLATEAVTNIVGRADVLAAFGVLGGFLSYLHARATSGSRRLAWLVALAAATSIGVFSKEGAVVIVGVIVLYEVVFHTRADAGHHIRRLPYSAIVAIGLPLIVMWQQRANVLGSSPPAEFPFVDNPIAGAGVARGLLTAVAVMGRYLRLVVWPARLSADYSYAQIPLASGSAPDWLAWIAVAAVAILVVSFSRRRPDAFFFGAFAFITFLPASNLLFPTGTIMAERLLYLPSVGLVALFVLGVDVAARRQSAPATAVPLLVGVLVVALAVRTWIRNPDWKDDVTLWTATARTSPASFKAHRALAEALYGSDAAHSQLDRAIGELEASVALLQPLPDALNDARTHRQLAAYYLERGDAIGRDALEHQAALPAKSVDAYRNAVATLKRCLTIIEAAARERPHASASADAYRLMSAAQVRLGQSSDAVDSAKRARALEPADVIGHRELAAALLAAQHADDAAVALMTGSLLTSSVELRQQLIAMYLQGLDRRGCAVVATNNGPVLNPACETVRTHLCAATADAVQLQLGVAQRDDAERLKTSAAELGCR